MARPKGTKYDTGVTPEMFLEKLRENHGNAYKTYTTLNVPVSQYYEWRKDPEFDKAFMKAKNDAKEYVESKLFELIDEGDRASIHFYLKCQGGYSEKKQLEIKSDNTVDVNQTIEDIKTELSD